MYRTYTGLHLIRYIQVLVNVYQIRCYSIYILKIIHTGSGMYYFRDVYRMTPHLVYNYKNYMVLTLPSTMPNFKVNLSKLQ